MSPVFPRSPPVQWLVTFGGAFLGAAAVTYLLAADRREILLSAVGFALLLTGIRPLLGKPRTAAANPVALTALGVAALILTDAAAVTAAELIVAVGGGVGGALALALLAWVWRRWVARGTTA